MWLKNVSREVIGSEMIKGKEPDHAGSYRPTAGNLSFFFVLSVVWQRIWHKLGGHNWVS